MLDKKKHHFLQLVIIFSAVTVISLLSAWGFRSKNETAMSMMGQSMGKMMSSMHGHNISLNDLFGSSPGMNMSTNMDSHHQGSNMMTSHFISTAVIAVLLPFIVSGTVFLFIMWMK